MDMLTYCAISMGVRLVDVQLLRVDADDENTTLLYSYPSDKWGKAGMHRLCFPDYFIKEQTNQQLLH